MPRHGGGGLGVGGVGGCCGGGAARGVRSVAPGGAGQKESSGRAASRAAWRWLCQSVAWSWRGVGCVGRCRWRGVGVALAVSDEVGGVALAVSDEVPGDALAVSDEVPGDALAVSDEVPGDADNGLHSCEICRRNLQRFSYIYNVKSC